MAESKMVESATKSVLTRLRVFDGVVLILANGKGAKCASFTCIKYKGVFTNEGSIWHWTERAKCPLSFYRRILLNHLLSNHQSSATYLSKRFKPIGICPARKFLYRNAALKCLDAVYVRLKFIKEAPVSESIGECKSVLAFYDFWSRSCSWMLELAGARMYQNMCGIL